MRALYRDETVARITDHPPPHRVDGMAVVRVALAGICNTDLELIKGYMDFRGVLGHEFVGTVADGPPAWNGHRVVGEINFACGRCPLCDVGLQRHCPTRRVMGILGADGAFAEYVAVPLANLHRVPDTVDDAHAVFTEPLAAAFEILDQVRLEPGADYVVLGDGKLGLLVAQVLSHAGARVLAVGKHPSNLAILARRGIATVELAAWRRTPADIVVEATGSPAGVAMAIDAVKPRGTIVLKSTVAEAGRLNLAPLVINEVTVIGSRCGRFAPALEALAGGTIDVTSLIAAQLPLSDGVEGLARAAEPGALKVLLQP